MVGLDLERTRKIIKTTRLYAFSFFFKENLSIVTWLSAHNSFLIKYYNSELIEYNN